MRQVTVEVEPLAKEKMLAFAQAVDTEIGGLLEVTLDGTALVVSDAWLVPQVVGPASVEFEPGHFEDHIKAKGWWTGKPMPWICMGIWHSHANFGVGMSGTDEHDLVRKYAMRGYLLNIIVNRKGEWCCQVDTMVGPEGGLPEDFALVTVPSRLVWLQDLDVLEQVEKEIKENVRKKVTPKVTVVGKPKGRRGDYFSLLEESGLEDDGWGEWPLGKSPGRTEEEIRAELSVPDKGVWVYDKKMKALVERNKSTGKMMRSIARWGKGEVTVYDKDEKPCLVMKNKGTETPRGLDFGPALL